MVVAPPWHELSLISYMLQFINRDSLPTQSTPMPALLRFHPSSTSACASRDVHKLTQNQCIINNTQKEQLLCMYCHILVWEQDSYEEEIGRSLKRKMGDLIFQSAGQGYSQSKCSGKCFQQMD